MAIAINLVFIMSPSKECLILHFASNIVQYCQFILESDKEDNIKGARDEYKDIKDTKGNEEAEGC